jgi:hypothetical protein
MDKKKQTTKKTIKLLKKMEEEPESEGEEEPESEGEDDAESEGEDDAESEGEEEPESEGEEEPESEGEEEEMEKEEDIPIELEDTGSEREITEKRKIMSANRISEYEYAKLIATRSRQLFNDIESTTLTEKEIDDLGGTNKTPYYFAVMEFDLGKLPLDIIRKYHDGHEEIWELKDMIMLKNTAPRFVDYISKT